MFLHSFFKHRVHIFDLILNSAMHDIYTSPLVFQMFFVRGTDLTFNRLFASFFTFFEIKNLKITISFYIVGNTTNSSEEYFFRLLSNALLTKRMECKKTFVTLDNYQIEVHKSNIFIVIFKNC